MKIFSLLTGLLLWSITAFAQFKPTPTPGTTQLDPNNPPVFEVPLLRARHDTATAVPIQYATAPFGQRPHAFRLTDTLLNLRVVRNPANGLPIFIEGSLQAALKTQARASAPHEAAQLYLDYLKTDLNIQQPAEEFVVTDTETDDLGFQHLRMRQVYKGLEVYGGEVRLHLRNGEVQVFNGRYFPTPTTINTHAAMTESDALARAWSHAAQTESISTFTPEIEKMAGKQVAKSQLMVYHLGGKADSPRLCWYFEIAPAVLSRWAYFVDAQTGEVLDRFSLVCHIAPEVEQGLEATHPQAEGDAAHSHFHSHLSPQEELAVMPPDDGPATAQAADLLGKTQTIHTYKVGNDYWMIDGSKPIFDAAQAQKLPEVQDLGALVGMDARNVVDAQGNFVAYRISTPNNVWNNPTAVSAQYNASKAFDYFYNTFGRKSIKNKSEDVVSVINVADADGTSMDNAFWNGEAMFYGNGKNLFLPLARSLDVGGHEMGHGVIGSSAGLEYRNESGALNESYADIFGSMIDRDDWKIGEDAVKPGVYAGGALRNLSDPHNGGFKLGDRGWQPKHMNEKYLGEGDNGGVHVNSGIVNHAFYLFASKVGKDQAEKVYYRALTTYLTRTSDFADARLAIMQAAKDLGGDAVAQEAGIAFDAVGIMDGNGGGGDPDPDPSTNPGTQYILAADTWKQSLHIFRPDGSAVASPLVEESIKSHPSITDDGSLIVYVNGAGQIRYVSIDWEKGLFEQGFIDDNTQWRNVVISKDGNRVAALTDAYDRQVLVADFTTDPATTKIFELYSPLYVNGVQWNTLQYSDAMEFDLSGQYLVFDGFNSISTGSGTYDYWDMGIARVWDNSKKTYADGTVDRIFSSLENGENIGNPAFSKNSPSIIAFDYAVDSNQDGVLDGSDEYAVMGFDFEKGKLGNVFTGGSTLGYPCYSTDDKHLLFNAFSTNDEPVVAFTQLGADKITGQGNAAIFKSGYTWGTWFATGKRPASTGLKSVQWSQGTVKLYPNPVQDQATLALSLTQSQTLHIQVLDMTGRCLRAETVEAPAGDFQHTLSLGNLVAGTYVVQIVAGQEVYAQRLVRQ